MFFYYNMSGTTFIIDTRNIQLGQVIRTNISDQGIFRVFYNDISGNMYCGLSRESNYKQVILNSQQNRKIINNKDPIVDNSGMNVPFYGGTYHENELTYVDNSNNFYIFQYPTLNVTGTDISQCGCDRGPISYFTEVQLQKYKHQGTLPTNDNTVIYDTQGFSAGISSKEMITAGGGNLNYNYQWYEQVAFGHCTTEDGGYALDPSMAAVIATEKGLDLGDASNNFIGSYSTKGLYADNSNNAFFGTGGSKLDMKNTTSATNYRPGIPCSTTMAMYVPDLINLNPTNPPVLTARGVTNKGLNTSTLGGWGNIGLPGGELNRFITEPWQTDISHNRNATPTTNSGPSSFNTKYYISSKRPGINKLDQNGDTTDPAVTNNVVGDTDSYYKGRWSIYVDVKNRIRSLTPPYSLIPNDTSGNIYISRSNRATKPVYTHLLIPHFTNNQINTNNEINNIFVDLDLDISKNSTVDNGAYNNIYAVPYFTVCSDASNEIFYGNAPYDLDSTNATEVILNSFQNLPNQNATSKHCKIKVDLSDNWLTTRWHIVYFSDTDPTGSAGAQQLGYATGISGETFDLGLINLARPINFRQYHYNINDTNLGLKDTDNKLGGFPSMDIDKDGIVHIAFLSKKFGGSNPYCIFYLKSKFVIPTTGTTASWESTIIDETIGTPGIGYYTDLSNNQPINLKISPYDNSTHITYQYKNNDGTFSIKYWTNSNNIRDISGIDSSLNYVGLHTKGATIDDISGSAEVYWDLSQVNCIFSRDYTRFDDNGNKIGLTIPHLKIKQFNNPYGGRHALGVGNTLSTTSGWNDGIIFNRTYLDKVYVIMNIKTPAAFNSVYTLFTLAGSGAGNPNGSLEALVTPETTNGGRISFGVPSNGSMVATTGDSIFTAGIPFKNGSPAPSTSFTLSTNTNYQLEFYMNRANLYALIRIKDLDNTNTPTNSPTFEYYDVSANGGFNLQDGNLSIGSRTHNLITSPLLGTIFKMSIYATDISNVPTFDLSRNGEIISDASGSFSSFYDNSGNTGLLIEPNINEFQVVNAVNSLNNGSFSGTSYIKKSVLHDVYYLQRIEDQVVLQNQYTQQIITAFDKFTVKNSLGYYEMWAAGARVYGANLKDKYPLLWKSLDGGRTWNEVTTYTLGVSGEEILDIKCFIDSNTGKWVFVCGENYLLAVTNDYNGINPGGGQLGQNWKVIGDAQGPGDGSPGGHFYRNILIPSINTFDFNSMEIVNINNTQSTDIFGGNAPGVNDFHLWIGTGKYHTDSFPAQPFTLTPPTGTTYDSSVRIVVESGSFNSEKYWFLINSSGTTIISTRNSNGAYLGDPSGSSPYTYATDDGLGAPYDKIHTLPQDTYTVQLWDNYGPFNNTPGSNDPGFGDGWHGKDLIVYGHPSGTELVRGTISSSGSPYQYGPTTITFTVAAPETISYPYLLPGYKDMLIRGNYTDYSDNKLDYSYNIVTNTILDTSNNPTKSINESFNSFSFGGDYSGNYVGNYNPDGYNYGIVSTDSYVYQTNNGGKNWEKRLGIDRLALFSPDVSRNVRGTWGTYVEKNPNQAGDFDNSGMYIQTSTEPWNGLPGFTVAYNDSSFNLAFHPNDNTDIKTSTWDPSLNANDFWNVKIPDNSGQPVLWRAGGGNTIKTYIDDIQSNGSIYKNKQQMWSYDDYVPKSTDNSNYSEQPNLYLRNSEAGNEWQRINISVVDFSLNTYNVSQSTKWGGFSDYDCSYSIVNLPFANIGSSSTVFNTVGDTNQYVGFYKLGRVPFKIFLVTNVNSGDPYTIDFTIKYKLNESVQYFLNANTRLNFEALGITVHIEEASKVFGSYGSYTEVLSFNTYSDSISQRTPGKTFKYRARLSNKYGFGWYSNESDEITTPAPSPTIDSLTIKTKLFENVVNWKPLLVDGVQSVYSYNIQKRYFDLSANDWREESGFTNFYTDLSGQIGSKLWTGPFDPNSNNNLPTPNDVNFVDVDLSLNTLYQYNITCFPLVSGSVPSETYTISAFVSNAVAQYVNYEYTPIDASFNISWTIDTDISSNCELTWDISWQEIRRDGTTDNSGVIQILDISAVLNNNQNLGEKRCVNLPLLNHHLQADASYNFRIKSDMSNNSQPITDYTPASDKFQQFLYGGYSMYDPSFVNTYFNYQEPPFLNNAVYDSNTDTVNVNWTIPSIPTNPVAYDLSFSNITTNRTDVSYNFFVKNNSFVDPSNNGKNFYPGDYNVRVRAYYGDQVPVDISLVSQFSNQLTMSGGGVPEHLPSNFTATPYNFQNQPGNLTDVSYVKLNWTLASNDEYSLTGFPIPENYTLIRKTASKDYNYVVDYVNNNISRLDTSFNDTNHPLAHQNPTVPRIYYYDLSANYL